MEEEFQNRVKHFKNLKSKYKATAYQDSAPSSLLYLILQKIDIGIKLTQIELDWLKEHKLFETVDSILKEEQRKAEEIIKLENEFYHLKSQYKIPSYWNSFKNDISSPLFAILWKLNSENHLSYKEIEWLKANQLVATVIMIEEMELQEQFIALKEKYHATKHYDSSPYNPLHTILKKLDTKSRLEDCEVEWLIHHELAETLAIFKQQEAEREAIFDQLKEKYQANKYTDVSTASLLYLILQKIDAKENLIYSEVNWLEQHGLTETIAIANELEKKQEFAILKTKYKADCIDEFSPSSHLYKVLKLIDTDNALQEENIEFLKEQRLYETIAIANEKYARNLKSRVTLGETLSDSEIDWLVNNNRSDIINFYQKHHFIQLKRKFGISDSKNQLSLEIFYKIMLKLESKERLDAISVAHLVERDLLSSRGKIAIAYYRLEAEFYEKEFHRTQKQSYIPTAGNYWRKAGEPQRALNLLTNIQLEKISDNHLKSDILVAKGAAFRDILDLINAEFSAKKAIEYHSENYQAYILLGIISYDRSNYLSGDLFFKEAIDLGAKPEEIDDEIKQVLKTIASDKHRQNTVEYLLKKDLERYAWAKFYHKRAKDKGLK
ncbi:hypothetical protein WA1_30370 [Scytonema hofmannii PCC 7110]|uniref:Uncharacterized protein n=1 Tax=Scytonema hofmannii PCC 7110 TaxID=128403 RepID=A0A139X4M0_9CYAN|nr:hypothetical protein [Scytonema hofmannii]KYC39647.1 hypothetical protein WA1_30370 [Scytonema hofmannii PCC 7110]